MNWNIAGGNCLLEGENKMDCSNQEIQKEKLECLNGIRGIAALFIACIYHLATVPFPYYEGFPFADNIFIDWIYRKGYLFVELFFVVSGFLAFYNYTDKILGGMSFFQFMKKRVVRIFPLMWVTLFTAVLGNLIYYCTHEHMFWWRGGNDSFFTLVLSCLGLQNLFSIGQSWNYPSWSLTEFFICWMIYYFIIRYSKGKDKFEIIGCIVMILIGMVIYLNPTITIAFYNHSVARGYIAFFSGGIVYHIYKKLDRKQRKKCGWICAIWLSIGFLFVLLGIPLGPETLIFGGFIFPVLLLMILSLKIVNHIFSFKILSYLGKISFAMYLGNFSVEIFLVLMNEWFRLDINASTKKFFIYYMILNIISASILHYLVEVKQIIK